MARARSAVYKMRPEVARYLTPGVTYDPLRQPMYDRVIQASPALGTIQFFQLPVGQGSPAKTLLDTNMRLQGQIPASHVFEVWSPRVVIMPLKATTAAAIAATNSIEDCYDLMIGGFLEFKLVGRPKLQCPLFYLPAGAGLSGLASISTNLVAAAGAGGSILGATNGDPSQLAPQRLDPFPVVIPPLQTFSFEVTFPSSIVLSANVNLWMVLDGILHQPALP